MRKAWQMIYNMFHHWAKWPHLLGFQHKHICTCWRKQQTKVSVSQAMETTTKWLKLQSIWTDKQVGFMGLGFIGGGGKQKSKSIYLLVKLSLNKCKTLLIWLCIKRNYFDYIPIFITTVLVRTDFNVFCSIFIHFAANKWYYFHPYR